LTDIEKAIEAAKKEDYLSAMNLLTDAFNAGQLTQKGPKTAEALSYYGLCLALVQKKYKQAIGFCQQAIDMNFYWPDHYANLTRVYLAASMRRKAVETIEKGRSMFPDDKLLKRVHVEMGIRTRPVIPFLARGNPINVALGRSRRASKIAEARKRKEERKRNGD